jgi:hypothetical protein
VHRYAARPRTVTRRRRIGLKASGALRISWHWRTIGAIELLLAAAAVAGIRLCAGHVGGVRTEQREPDARPPALPLFVAMKEAGLSMALAARG